MQAKLNQLIPQLEKAIRRNNYRQIQFILTLIREAGIQIKGRLNAKKADLYLIAEGVLNFYYCG